MHLLELKCTNCAGKLVKKGMISYECPYCEASYLLGIVPSKTKAKKENKEQKINMETALLFSIVAFILAGITLSIIGVRNMNTRNDDNEYQWVEVTPPMTTLDVDSDASEGMTWQEAIDAGVIVFVKPKEGEGYQSFIEKVFGKSFEQVTQEDMESVSSISFSGSGDMHQVTCVVGGVKKLFAYEGSATYILPNIHYFGNLETLLVHNSVENVNFEALPKLTSLSCSSSMVELARFHPHPEQLIYLTGVNIDEDEKIIGLEKFSGLRTLEVCVYDRLDLSAFSVLQNLEKISIDAYEAKNFNFLGELTKLKSVNIDAGNLYSIEFARNLKDLEELNIERTKVSTLKPLTNNTKLKYLNIYNCSSIKDAEVINSLTGLEKLVVSGSVIKDKIGWENLQNLKDLSIMAPWQTNFMDSIPHLQGVERLHLSWCSMSLRRLAELENLKHLTIEETDEDLHVLKELSKLESLKLVKMDYVEGAENVFALPQIQEVTFEDCSFIMDFEKISKCSSLKKLETMYCRFADIIIEEEKAHYSYYDDCEEVDLGDKLFILEGFANLEELMIRGAKLENVEFACGLEHLERLDVTNNNISDVSPLMQCKNLKYLCCGDNALLETPVFPVDIVVDMQEETNILYN